MSMAAGVTLGRSLRRFRRLRSIKQAHLAELLGVSQATVSRWESGAQRPDSAACGRIIDLIAGHADDAADAALKRLITSSRLRVHLICDATHRLLAASPGRAAAWRVDVGAYIGSSLWRHASPEIIAAEAGLADRGWFDCPFNRLRFHTGPNASDEIAITPGVMEWESIVLSDGRIGRLTTAIDGDV